MLKQVLQLIAVIATAIALLSPSNADAACAVVSKHNDWEVYKCENFEDDSNFYIATSSDAEIKRASFPYADGPYVLQYECYERESGMRILAADGVNFRSNGDGKVKFGTDAPRGKYMSESDSSPHYVDFIMSPKDWNDSIDSNRLRAWLPYFSGDIIVDFSLDGFVVAAKEVERKHGRDNALAYSTQRILGEPECRFLIKDAFREAKRGNKSSVRSLREKFDARCLHHGDITIVYEGERKTIDDLSNLD